MNIKEFFRHIFTKHKVPVILIMAAIIVSLYYFTNKAPASNTGPFSPGETLNPPCGPLVANCNVESTNVDFQGILDAENTGEGVPVYTGKSEEGTGFIFKTLNSNSAALTISDSDNDNDIDFSLDSSKLSFPSSQITDKGVAGGLATLDSNGLIPVEQLGTGLGSLASLKKHFTEKIDNVTSNNIMSNSCGDYATLSVNRTEPGDIVNATPYPLSEGIENSNLTWKAFVSSSGTVKIRACNTSSGSVDTADSQSWLLDIWGY